MTTRCVIYARQSLDRTGEGAAVDRQVADCRRLAEVRGWDVLHVISDNDLSASTGVRRPGYERVVDLMLAGQVDVVICWHFDRLTRRLSDLEQVISICETTGVRLATVTGDLDLSNDTGQLLARILASVAAAEGKRKGARQRAANTQRREKGEMGWTRRPFGYDRDAHGGIVVVEDEATALRAAADTVLAGSTLAAAVRLLTDKGLTTTGRRVLRDGDGNPLRDEQGRPQHGPWLPWNVTSLRRTLTNPRYSARVSYRGVLVPDVEGAWPVILDADMQDQLTEKLRDVKRRLQQGTEVRYLLSGLARCGRCGSVMFATTAAPKEKLRYRVYRCSGKGCYLTRRLDLVDEVVEGVLIARLSQPDAARVFAPKADLDALRAEAVELRRRRDDLAELLAAGLLSRGKVTEQAGKLTRRLAEIDGRITAAFGDSPAAALVAADDVAAAWAGLDLRTKKKAIEALMVVTILPVTRGARFDPEQVQIEWRRPC